MIADVWNDPKILNLDHLMIGIANSLKTNLNCHEDAQWSTWALLVKKKNYEFDWGLKLNL